MSEPVVGVLALQGDFAEHLRALSALGVRAIKLRTPEELRACDGLVVPGGESTTMIKLVAAFGLLNPLRERIADGMPTFGTCAGMILLANQLADSNQPTVGGLDVVVRRNAFGRQVDSFEQDLSFTGVDQPVHAVFIRAPWVESVGTDVEILARVAGSGPVDSAGKIVAVRQRNVMATAFHPEVGDDPRVHALFVEQITSS